jgi:hypothetical protein
MDVTVAFVATGRDDVAIPVFVPTE